MIEPLGVDLTDLDIRHSVPTVRHRETRLSAIIWYNGGMTSRIPSPGSPDFDIDAIVSSYSEIIVESWTKALARGWEDIVFVWMVEGEDLRSVCMRREAVLSAFRSETAVPSSPISAITEVIASPAGAGKAWLVLSGPGFLSSTCVEYSKILPKHLLN